MRMRQLEKSGLIVSELCLGTMIFGEVSQRNTSLEDARRIIDHYLDAGGNFFDTANVYAEGRSEQIVGEAIIGRRDEVVLATKVRFRRGKGANDIGLSRRRILQEVENSLRRLKTDYREYIDLFLSEGVGSVPWGP